MEDIYKILKPILTSETVTSALRQAGLVRQARLAAALRKEPLQARFGLSIIKAQHDFMSALTQAFMEAEVANEVCDAIGYHSFFFMGPNPRVVEMLYLATAGEEEYSLERLAEILKAQTDIDAIIRGEEDPIDTLRWLNYTGNNFAGYLVKLAV